MRLEDLTPSEVRDAAARGVPLLLPVGVLENHGYHNPCGLDLLCCRGTPRRTLRRPFAAPRTVRYYHPGLA